MGEYLKIAKEIADRTCGTTNFRITPTPKDRLGVVASVPKVKGLARDIDAHHVYLFLADHIIPAPSRHWDCPNRITYQVEAETFYRGYGHWCYEKRIKPLTRERFRTTVEGLLYNAKYREFRDGKTVDDWTGFRYISGRAPGNLRNKAILRGAF